MGWRAVAANLSDLAASGAVIIDGITVALVAPGHHTPWSWVEGFTAASTQRCLSTAERLLGGDCSSGVTACFRSLRSVDTRALAAASFPGKAWRLNRGERSSWTEPTGIGPASRGSLVAGCHPANASFRAKRSASTNDPDRGWMPSKLLVTCKPAHLPWRAGGTDSSDGLLTAVRLSLPKQWLRRCSRPKTLTESSCGWPDGPHWQRWCPERW